MGKSSSSSCLKIIVCGSDSAHNDDTLSSSSTPPQTKPSSDKRGWSFRKRSGRHRVLGNNVGSETTASPNKEAPQSGTIEFQSPVKSTIVDEKPPPPKHIEEISKPVVLTENYSVPKPSMEMVSPEKADSKVSRDELPLESISHETSAEYKMVDIAVGPDDDDNETSDELSLANESVVSKDENIGLAEAKISESEKVLENDHENGVLVDESVAIIIQTALRGFLAQKEYMRLKSAVKLQAAVRGHFVRRNAVATLHCIRAIVKIQALVRARNSKSLKNKPDDAQFSTVKLLQNSLARQLLESNSKPKSLNIKCDPMTPNSSWSWLERWMAVSTPEATKNLDPTIEPEVENENENEEEVEKITNQADAELSSLVLSESIDSKISVEEEKSMANEENIVFDDISTIDSSTTEVINEQFHAEKEEIDNNDVTFTIADVDNIEVSEKTSLEDEIDIPLTGPTEIQESKPSPTVSEPIEIEQPKLSTKRSATSDLNGEGKKFIYGSRKASNPAFIAAQSKFEELTNNLSYEESVKKTNELGDVETSITSNPRIHVAGSECGTELSISSTLDSPDRSEIENIEVDPQVHETSYQPVVDLKQDCEVNDIPSESLNDETSIRIPESEVVETETASFEPISPEISPQNLEIESEVTRMEESSPVVVDNPKNEENGYKSTPEASPISHKTVPESQGTPSSQSSVKGKKTKKDKHRSHKKRSSPSSEKKSSPNVNIDSGARSSTEHLPKDHKSGKRRNSFGSTKSDNAEQEARDSSNRTSLPSYMQATESARAKANSPRSSPDVHDKEVYSKKRHSLPGVTGKQSSSPHAQRSASQVAQGTKTNGSNPSNNERKWLR